MMKRSPASARLWHQIDHPLREALMNGASWDEAISSLRDKAAYLERLRDSGARPETYRRGERI